MIYRRSHCDCECHVKPGYIHVNPCCKPDEEFEIKTAVAERNEQEHKRTWNAAIDAAIELANRMRYVTAEELRSLKKELKK